MRLLPALAFLCLIADPALADPVTYLHWDACDDGSGTQSRNKDFAGAGTYAQVISGRGFTGGARGVIVDVEARGLDPAKT